METLYQFISTTFSVAELKFAPSSFSFNDARRDFDCPCLPQHSVVSKIMRGWGSSIIRHQRAFMIRRKRNR